MQDQRSTKTLAIISSLTAGILIATLTQINAGLGKYIGALESTFYAHISGSFLGLFVLFFVKKKGLIQKTLSLPKHLFLGGIFGVFVTFVGTIAVPHMGLLLFISILITFDLLFSTGADHFGLFGLDKYKINLKRTAGLLLALVGVAFIFWS